MTSTVIDAGDGLPLTIGALIRARAAERGDDPFVVVDDDVLTYRQADERSAVLARALLASGAGAGTHLGVLQPNGSPFVVSWLAAARIGAVTLPFSTFSTPGELTGLLNGADVELLIAAPGYRGHRYDDTLTKAVDDLDLSAPQPLMAPAVPVLRRIWFDDATDSPTHADWTLDALLVRADEVGDDVLEAAEAAVTPAHRMVIVHTSGSTSAPKGVIHTHGALIRHMANLNEVRRYGPGEVMFSNSPLFWVGGFAFSLLATLVAGARIVISNAADASAVLDLIERERPTLANGFAQSVAHLPDDPTFADRDLSSIRRGNLWAILAPDVRPADPELRPTMLGLTETGSVCLLPNADEEVDLPEAKRGLFGRPAPGFEARVVDPDTGDPTPTGEVGELWFRGPFLFEGYYGKERGEAFDADGWFHTGDLVVVDAEGLYYFKGRAGDMIKTSGANVSPREVEAAIASVAGWRSHVIGLDDPEKGQLVAAAVVAPAGAAIDDAALDRLRVDLRAELSSYKVPKVVAVLTEDEVPMLSTGKLDGRTLKAILGERRGA